MKKGIAYVYVCLFIIVLMLFVQGVILSKRMFESSWVQKLLEVSPVKYFNNMETGPLIGVFIATSVIWVIIFIRLQLEDGLGR